MANLRKIGAIATGALFVGATLGSAAAVTFSPSMIVKDGAAVAKLVVGTKNPDASGLAADEASANSVGTTVSTKYTAPAAGANIQFKYDGQDIDGLTTTADDYIRSFANAQYTGLKNNEGNWTSNNTVSAKTANLTSWSIRPNDINYNTGKDSKIGIRFDANGDGDVEDTDDQTIYNDIRIESVSTTDLQITPAMRVLGNLSAGAGKVFTLRGKKYYFKEYKSDQGKVTWIPTTEKTLFMPSDASGLLDAGVLVPGTDIKIALKGGSNTSAEFAIIQGGAIVETKTGKDITVATKDLELLSDYFIAATTYRVAGTGTFAAGDWVTLSIAKKSDEFSIYDDDKNVLGYAKAVIDKTSTWVSKDELRFEDETIKINKDSSAALGATTATAKYNKDKEFDVVAKKTKTSASGSEIKSDRDPWDDFLKTEANGGVDKLTVTAVGSNIQFKYDGQDVDGLTTTADDYNRLLANATYTGLKNNEGKWTSGNINASVNGTTQAVNTANITSWYIISNDIKHNTGKDSKIGIRFDANGDGDVEDTDDQTIYNDIRIESVSTTDLQITPAMRVLGNLSAGAGKVFTLRGKKYYFKEYKSDQGKVTWIPTTEKTLFMPSDASGLLDAGVLVPGTDIKIALKGGSNTSAEFAIIQGGAIVETKTGKDITVATKDLELLSDYFIAATTYRVAGTGTFAAGDWVTLSIAKKSDEFSIYDDDKNVLGYAKAVIDKTSTWVSKDELRFEDETIKINKDSSAALGATTATAKYNKDKEFDVVAKKTKTSASGSEIKSDRDPWDDFLKTEANGGVDKLTVSAVGGTGAAISLSVVKDTAVTDADKSGYNLVLVGGPVANSLTAELVTKGTSKVNWEASAGEIEVVENAFASGKYAIVAAGKDRAATKKAADALIAQL